MWRSLRHTARLSLIPVEGGAQMSQEALIALCSAVVPLCLIWTAWWVTTQDTLCTWRNRLEKLLWLMSSLAWGILMAGIVLTQAKITLCSWAYWATVGALTAIGMIASLFFAPIAHDWMKSLKKALFYEP